MEYRRSSLSGSPPTNHAPYGLGQPGSSRMNHAPYGLGHIGLSRMSHAPYGLGQSHTPYGLGHIGSSRTSHARYSLGQTGLSRTSHAPYSLGHIGPSQTSHARYGLGQIGLSQRANVIPYGIQVHRSFIDHSQINDQMITTVTEVSTTKFILPKQPNFQSFRPSVLNTYNLFSTGPENSTNNIETTTVQRPGGDGRTHSLPHRKYGPYKCPKCRGEFRVSQQFAAHVLTHYKDESVEERKRRLEAKYRTKKPRLACSGEGRVKEENGDDVKKEEGGNSGEICRNNGDGAKIDEKLI